MIPFSDGAQKQVSNGLVIPFTINGQGSGTLIFKVVIMVFYVDINATGTAVRTKLTSFDRATRELESEIEKLIDHVVSLISTAVCPRGADLGSSCYPFLRLQGM
jgi:hypothetical protein